MENDVTIFICTHKDVKLPVSNEKYAILDSRKIKDEGITYMGLDDKFWSEILGMFYVYDNVKLGKYVGFCHYRRFFSFLDNIPDMDEIFKQHNAILTIPNAFMDENNEKKSMREQYNISHRKEDLDIIESIIKEKYKSYYDAFMWTLDNADFFPCNMFIMRTDDFYQYIEFIRGVMEEYIKRIGGDFDKYFKENLNTFDNGVGDANYQYRLGGFLAERLTNVFVSKNFRQVQVYGIVMTEQ